ncbi:TIGR03746 family integrating conjugative element protein [Klebsiella variicola]|uniref:PFL_4703 family integrating conjugative element protein n=1 Tax=Klebsiella variicola TaxID=244366 RepID=UPI001C979AD2|nr:TIGR03746 family integrating conjugative element protein [Klebsiella variicola]MBY5172964.1 TIGR03746 family integrating conjugative element protein [Klebsiella variicola]
MSRFKNALSARDNHILTLRALAGGLFLALLLSLWGWKSAPADLTIHNPPDLRSGSTRKWWDIDPSNVYAFAFYIFQQLHSWQKNGAEDYPARIDSLAAYLTPACRDFLQRDVRTRAIAGELDGRTRQLAEIPGHGLGNPVAGTDGQSRPRVKITDQDNWVVTLDLATREYFLGEEIKLSPVRYPLKVTRWPGDPEMNPFGLALDCYDGLPQRLGVQAPETPVKKGGLF